MRIYKKIKKIAGFSLTEILLSMGLFAMLSTSVIFFSLDSIRINKNTSLKITSSLYFQEYYNAIMSDKNSSWASIVLNTNAGDKKLVYQGEKYVIADGKDNTNGLNIYFNVLEAYRDGTGKLVETGGTVDPHTRIIALKSDWIDIYGKTQNYTSEIYVNDWATYSWKETVTADFSDGTFDKSIVTTKVNGEVQLGSITYPDWCKPSLTQNMYDLPGQGIAKTISAQPGNIYMGTGSNSSGVSFARLSFEPLEPPVVKTIGIFDGYKTNAVYGEGNYAYLATQTNSKEIVILDVSKTPYVEIGYFNPPVNSQGYGIFVNGTVGVMATATRLYTFDLTAKTGARPVLGYINLKGTATDLFVRGNFAYLTESNAIEELEIIDFSTPATPTSVGWYDVNTTNAVSVFVNEANTRAYLATAATSTQKEFFIIDVANKVGNHVALGGYETNGLTATDIVVPSGSNRAIIVGKTGTEQYQVVDITSESNPVKCGALAITNGVNAIATVTEANGNVYSHIVTTDAASELRTIRGGEGGGNADGTGFPSSGTYISNIFDTGSSSAQYYTIQWTGTIPANTQIRIQVRSGTPADIPTKQFVGPDGTASSYYSTPTTAQILPISLNSNRFFQYKITFISNGLASPSLSDITFTYQR
jgi:hypothetical protein